MTKKAYFVACGSIFFVLAAVHLTRLVTGWDLLLAGWAVPRWLSIPGLIVPGILSAWGFVLASRAGSRAGGR